MSTILKQVDPRLISFEEASQLLGGLSTSAIRQRKSGTAGLTHVPGFGRRVFLIRAEVEALIAERIEQAKAKHRKNFRVVKEAI